MQSPEPVKIPRYDEMTGLPLKPRFNAYTGQPLDNQPYSVPMRQPTFTNQQVVPLPPSYQPSYEQPGISGQIAGILTPVMGNIYGPQFGQFGIPPSITINVEQPLFGPLQCQYCRRTTGQTVRRKNGSTTIAWGVCLWFWTGFLCWVPCIMDGCKDAQLVCVTCNHVKSIIHAPCCC